MDLRQYHLPTFLKTLCKHQRYTLAKILIEITPRISIVVKYKRVCHKSLDCDSEKSVKSCFENKLVEIFKKCFRSTCSKMGYVVENRHLQSCELGGQMIHNSVRVPRYIFAIQTSCFTTFALVLKSSDQHISKGFCISSEGDEKEKSTFQLLDIWSLLKVKQVKIKRGKRRIGNEDIAIAKTNAILPDGFIFQEF